MQTRKVSCNCGEVELEFRGKPMVVAACHCDDCQAAGHQIESLPGSPKVLDHWGGTHAFMLRKDRMRVARGEDKLQAVAIKPKSPTRRYIAACCNTPMYMGFKSGPYWVNIFLQRFGENAPPIEFRVQTRFAPEGSAFDDGIPAFKTFPFRLIRTLLGTRVAMMFTK